MPLIFECVTYTELSWPYLGSIWTRGSWDPFGSLKTSWTKFSSFSWNSTLSLGGRSFSVFRFSLSGTQFHCQLNRNYLDVLDMTYPWSDLSHCSQLSGNTLERHKTEVWTTIIYKASYQAASFCFMFDIDRSWRVDNYGGTVQYNWVEHLNLWQTAPWIQSPSVCLKLT